MGRAVAENETWKRAAAAARGTGHAAAGLPCQDKVYTLDAAGTYAVALADGAGSAALSHLGAELAARRAAEIAAERFDEVFRRGISAERFGAWLARGLQWELSQYAAGVLRGEAQARDLASTLLCVAVRDNRWLAFHLGDGVIGMQTHRRAWPAHPWFHDHGAGHGHGTHVQRMHVLSAPSNGEFANETVFTTSAQAPSQLRVLRGCLDGAGRSVTGFVLMSDGSEASLYHKRTRTLASATGKLLSSTRTAEPERMQAQLSSLLEEKLATKTQDDCSLALLARVG